MRKLTSVTVALAFLLASASALAGRGMMGAGKGPPPAVAKKALKDAGLSDQQIRRIETLRLESDKQALDIRHEIQKERLELRRLMQAEKPDRASIFKQLDRISGLQLQLKKSRVGHMLDVRAEMTAEQWDKVQQIFFEWKAQHHQGRKGFRHGAGPEAGGDPAAGPGQAR